MNLLFYIAWYFEKLLRIIYYFTGNYDLIFNFKIINHYIQITV